VRKRFTRFSRALPAMIAALIAPIEIPLGQKIETVERIFGVASSGGVPRSD
jgi:hypothetical protein